MTASGVRLLALAAAAGVVDAADFLGLGRVFTANMTGNTVLLGVALARGVGADAARSGAALGGFCLGVAISTALMPRARGPWPAVARWAFLIEVVALALLLAGWVAFGAAPVIYPLIAASGIAMGSQSAAVRSSDIRGVNTTYMTSTLLGAIAGVVNRARGVPEPSDPGPRLPAAAWLIYAAGATAGAFGELAWHAWVIAIPLAIVGGVAVQAWLGERDRSKI